MIRSATLKQEKTRERRRHKIGLFCFGHQSSGVSWGHLRTSGFRFQGSGFRIGGSGFVEFIHARAR